MLKAQELIIQVFEEFFKKLKLPQQQLTGMRELIKNALTGELAHDIPGLYLWVSSVLQTIAKVQQGQNEHISFSPKTEQAANNLIEFAAGIKPLIVGDDKELHLEDIIEYHRKLRRSFGFQKIAIENKLTQLLVDLFKGIKEKTTSVEKKLMALIPPELHQQFQLQTNDLAALSETLNKAKEKIKDKKIHAEIDNLFAQLYRLSTKSDLVGSYCESVELFDYDTMVEIGRKVTQDKELNEIVATSIPDFEQAWTAETDKLQEKSEGNYSIDELLKFTQDIEHLINTMEQIHVFNTDELEDAKQKIMTLYTHRGLTINSSAVQELTKNLSDPANMKVFVAAILIMGSRYISDEEYEMQNYAKIFGLNDKEIGSFQDLLITALGFNVFPTIKQEQFQLLYAYIANMSVKERQHYIESNKGVSDDTIELVCQAAIDVNKHVNEEIKRRLPGIQKLSREEIKNLQAENAKAITKLQGRDDAIFELSVAVELQVLYSDILARNDTSNKKKFGI